MARAQAWFSGSDGCCSEGAGAWKIAGGGVVLLVLVEWCSKCSVVYWLALVAWAGGRRTFDSCLLACLPASLPAFFAHQPLASNQPLDSPDFSTQRLQRAPDSHFKPSRVSTESKRTSTRQPESLTSTILWT